MKKFALITLTLCFVTAVASSALALRWPDNMSYRVESMGGAILSIEDESTALTVFNHQNIAGAALNKKMDRIDIGVGLNSECDKTETTNTFGTTTTVDISETSTSGLDLTRPGAEYRGLTYWLNDNLVLRAGIEGLTYDVKTEDSTEIQTPTTTTTTTTDDTFAATGLGGGASISYKFDAGLAVGAGISYKSAGGKPGDLEDMFDTYGGGQTTKVELSVTNLDWAVGAAIELPELGGEANKLTLGLSIHADDDMPNFEAVIAGATNPAFYGDYSVVAKSEGTIIALGDVAVTDTYTYTLSPMVISAEAIFNVGAMIEAGLLFDYKMSSMNTKKEYTGYPTGFSTDVDYKNADISIMGITPVITANVPAGEDLKVLGGLFLSTWGSGKTDNYALDGTTTDENDTYKNDVDEISSTLLGIGAGIQAMGTKLQVGVQFETGGINVDDTNYNTSGTIVQQFDSRIGATVNTYTTEYGISNIRIGGEFWIMPMFAVRAGYAILSQTEKNGYLNPNGTYEDETETTGRFTLGAGVALPQGTNLDLLIRLDNSSTNPETPNTEVTDTATAILLAAKILL